MHRKHSKNTSKMHLCCVFDAFFWVTWPTHHKHGKITNVFGSHYRRLFLLSAQRWKPYFWANYFRWPNIRCITTWKHLITPILCRGDIWGLIDPRSLLQEYLSLHISITSDVYIPCDGNKSDHKKKNLKCPRPPVQTRMHMLVALAYVNGDCTTRVGYCRERQRESNNSNNRPSL